MTESEWVEIENRFRAAAYWDSVFAQAKREVGLAPLCAAYDPMASLDAEEQI
jgi:hypothetical protein